jgi:predicted 3-demethylubiquinone-9 3-methyltransferase (glyoxalase superfamily)
MALQKITPFLWFDTQAADAAAFYVTIFPNSEVSSSNPLITTFVLDGLQIIAMNGGPQFKLDEAFSFVIYCETQGEIDYYWDKLTEGGTPSHCGWLKDKYGLSWQVVPSILPELMGDPERSQRVMDAFLKMTKFDVKTLLEA